MKAHALIFFLLIFSGTGRAQSAMIDTLLDMGGYQLHFQVIPGKGTPILFESGAGDDGSVWGDLLAPLHRVTETTLITYDRAGFGKSGFNPHKGRDEEHGILAGVEELEKALAMLGYDGGIILVAHSYGGFYTTLFSARNPGKARYNVRVDANLAGQYTDEVLVKAMEDNRVLELKDKHRGKYYLGINFARTVRLMRETPYPPSVPAIDIVSPIQRHHTDEEWDLLMRTHRAFVAEAPNRTAIIAEGCGHYIFLDNPALVIHAVTKAYVETLENPEEKCAVLQRSLDQAIAFSASGKETPDD